MLLVRPPQWSQLPPLLEGLDRGRVVLVSSAMVYGAWPNNPVPIDESAALRPNPGHAEAASAAEAERRARRWQQTSEGRELVVLRPVPVVAPGLAPPAHLPLVDSSAPLQFLHPADLESAVDHAATVAPGTYNVAPDGSVDADTARALVRGMATPGLPRKVAHLVAGWSGRLSAPAGVSFSVFPWVVDNHKLKDSGWAPEHSSDEAWVSAYPGSELAELPAGRRQKVVLALATSGVALVGTVIVEVLRRRRHPPNK